LLDSEGLVIFLDEFFVRNAQAEESRDENSKSNQNIGYSSYLSPQFGRSNLVEIVRAVNAVATDSHTDGEFACEDHPDVIVEGDYRPHDHDGVAGHDHLPFAKAHEEAATQGTDHRSNVLSSSQQDRPFGGITRLKPLPSLLVSNFERSLQSIPRGQAVPKIHHAKAKREDQTPHIALFDG